MKQCLLQLLFVLSSVFAFGQNIVEDATALMKAGMIGEAEDLVNRYLMQDPINVDAIMMKGNMVLNKYLYQQQLQGSMLRNFEEDIYHPGKMEKGASPVILPDTVAAGIEKLWLAALKLDPERRNIQLGLCQLYALSLQRLKLLTQFHHIAQQFSKNAADLHAQFANYARYLSDRGDFDGMMAGYRKIYQLFPTQTGILSDMAGAFFSREKLTAHCTTSDFL